MDRHALSERRRRLNAFLAAQQTRAYSLAHAMTRNPDDALDLVQDSMLRLARHYGERREEEWTLLFYRILNNLIRDFHRRRTLSRWLPFSEALDGLEEHPAAGTSSEDPQRQAQQDGELKRIHQALARLPLRQQQVFLLRAWQEFSTAETAAALGIAKTSVKTHYRRAISRLRQLLNTDGVPDEDR